MKKASDNKKLRIRQNYLVHIRLHDEGEFLYTQQMMAIHRLTAKGLRHLYHII